MRARHLSLALALQGALGVAALPVLAQGARHGGGAGGPHGGGGGGHAVPRVSTPAAGPHVGSGPAYAPRASAAQLRHPRAGTGTGSRGYYGYGPYYGYGSYHEGHYPPYRGYYGGAYRPYYGYYGYYGPYYGGYYPYAYGSFYFGWPYDSSSAWPYGSVVYYDAPDYTVVYDSPTSYRSRGVGQPTAPAPGAGSSEAPEPEAGRVRLEVRPIDASVYVDDEFRGTASQARSLTLRPGRHSIELVRPGYATELRQVDVVTGQRQDVLVELQRR
jgi:hypothetical protein